MPFSQWSTTPADNASGVTNINWAEGQPPSSVNDSARQMMADLAAAFNTSATPNFTAIELGHATDTTISRTGAGEIAVEGNRIFRVGGADVPVADGGTGASTAAAAATNLGLGTGDSPQFTAVNIGHASDTTITRTGAGDIAVEGNAVYRAGGTDVPVTDGGTGASTAANARTNLGAAGTGANVFTGAQGISGTSPQFYLRQTDGAADNQVWDFFVSGEALRMRILNDAFGVAAEVVRIDRTGTTVDSVAFTTPVLTNTGPITVNSGTAIPAGGTAGAGLKVSSTANFGVFFGSGAPTLSAAKGSLYLRSDGSTTNDRMYVNTNGTTTWTAVTTVA